MSRNCQPLADRIGTFFDTTYGYGLNQTYKDYAGDLAYVAGYFAPDLLMSLAMPGFGAVKTGSYIDDATKASSKYYDDLIEYWRVQFNNGGKAASGIADDAVAYADDLVYNGENWIDLEIPKFNSNQEALDFYYNLTDELNINTTTDQAVFYSGKGNRELAEEFALLNEKTTLEMTNGGKYLENLKLFDNASPFTKEQAREIWARLSARYAKNASGNVYGFASGSSLDSIFNTIEYPILSSQDNINITNIFTELFN